jgi:hypothetical protein
MSQYTATEKAKEARREVLMRERVYLNRVEKKLMSRDEAARKIAIMEDIAQDYEEQAKKERLL